MKRRIIIRADGNSAIGMGHVVRSMALAGMLKQDFHIAFAIQNPSPTAIETINAHTKEIIELPETIDFKEDGKNFIKHLSATDIVVLDGYQFKTDYQQAIKDKGCKVVFIDDLHDWHQVADVVINHADGISTSVYSFEKYTRFYLGLDYALLRPEFLNPDKKTREITAISKIFISMGAADADGNTLKFTKALVKLNKVKELHLMLSPVNPHLKEVFAFIENNPKQNIFTHFNISAAEIKALLTGCDLAICPASSIAIECCAIGIPLIAGLTAENQLGNLRGMEKHKTLVNFGVFKDLSENDISEKVDVLLDQPVYFNELMQNQKKMIDGRSAERIRAIFNEL